MRNKSDLRIPKALKILKKKIELEDLDFRYPIGIFVNETQQNIFLLDVARPLNSRLIKASVFQDHKT